MLSCLSGKNLFEEFFGCDILSVIQPKRSIMLKKFASLTLIYTMFMLTSYSSQVFSQAQTNGPKAEQTDAAKTEPVSPKPDARKVFEKELSKSKLEKEEAAVDFAKIEKDQYKKAQKGKGLTKKEKVLIFVIIAGAVIGGILLWKFVKLPKCSQVECDPDFDENCFCDDGT